MVPIHLLRNILGFTKPVLSEKALALQNDEILVLLEAILMRNLELFYLRRIQKVLSDRNTIIYKTCTLTWPVLRVPRTQKVFIEFGLVYL